MAGQVKELGKRIKGSLAETEDWWNLKCDEDGTLYVEHSWSHTKLKGLTTDAGKKRYTVDEFLGVEHSWASGPQETLRAYLAENT